MCRENVVAAAAKLRVAACELRHVRNRLLTAVAVVAAGREVDAHARQVVELPCADVVAHDALVGGLQHVRGLRRNGACAVNQRHHVHHVGGRIVKIAESVHALTGAAEGGQLPCVERLREIRRVGFHRADQIFHRGQVEDAHAEVVVRILVQTGLHVRIGNRDADALRVQRRIFAQRVQPRIIPAQPRLQFLAGDHEISVILHMRRRLIRRHQTGVEANHVQMKIGIRFREVVQRVVDFVNRQPVVIRRFVKANAAVRAAAVIPEDQHVAVGRVGRNRPVQIVLQRLLRAHVLPRANFHVGEIVVCNREAVDAVRAQTAVIPFTCAACLHDDGHVVRNLRRAHLV